MKSGKLLLLLSLFCISVILTDDAWAQRTPQPFPGPGTVDPPQDWREWIFRNNSFRAGGVEAGVSTYNYYIGFPVFWVQNQVKLVPQMSLFWKQPESWRHKQAYGGRALFFLNNQFLLNADIIISKGTLSPDVKAVEPLDSEYCCTISSKALYQPKIFLFIKGAITK